MSFRQAKKDFYVVLHFRKGRIRGRAKLTVKQAAMYESKSKAEFNAIKATSFGGGKAVVAKVVETIGEDDR